MIIYLLVLSGDGRIPRIADYGVIGNCRSAALVSRFGSIDWLCWPRFDSPSIFAAILDSNRHKAGFWSMAPPARCQVQRRYVPDSNVLETEFLGASGRAVLTDLMPIASEEFKRENMVPSHELLRRLVCTDGELEIEINFHPRICYGAGPVQIRDLGACGLRMDARRGAYWLRSTVRLQLSDDRAYAVVGLKRGDEIQLSLSYSEESPAVLPALGERARAAIDRSNRWWQQWTARGRYQGPYRQAVARSALALKLLAYAPSGAIVAAATTSLPERICDSLNWDYRYCWLRDASLTIRALLGLGYMEEAEGFMTWLLHATRLTQPQLHILYTVFGQIAPAERELKHLSGHRESRPVRIGNDARHQLQLDVYGEVIDAAAQYGQHLHRFDRSTQKVLIGLGKHVAKHWDQPDEGIWEPRSGRRNHTHSRLLCWTALDRLLALEEKGKLSGVPRAWFERERERIKQQICHRGWNHELHSHVGALDGDTLDATLLRIPWYGFEEASSERMRLTYHRVRERLGAHSGLMYRYQREPKEGAFGVCGFWGVEHLALGGGTLEQAQHEFQLLLAFANDLGLFAEETDPASGDALGNFPQAFTHVGLISAALTLEEKERGQSHPAMHIGGDVQAPGQEARV